MSLFACTRCGSVDDTQFTHYSVRQWDGDPPLCSACDPDIGKWHDIFPRRHWTVEDNIINRDEVTVSTTGNVTWTAEQLDQIQREARQQAAEMHVVLKPPLPAEQLKPGQVWVWIHDEVWQDPTDPEPPGHWEIRGTGAIVPPEMQRKPPL